MNRKATMSKLLGTTLLAFSMLHAAGARADDTEMYLAGQQKEDKALPNMLFLLDVSLSMNETVKAYKGQPSPLPKKIDELKTAMIQLLTQASGMNIGIAQFPPPAGVKTPYKMAILDRALPIDGYIGASDQPTIDMSTDDATQTGTDTSTKRINGPLLTMGNLPNASGQSRQFELRSDILTDSAYAVQGNWTNGSIDTGHYSNPSANNAVLCSAKPTNEMLSLREQCNTQLVEIKHQTTPGSAIKSFNIAGNNNSTGGTVLFTFHNINIPAGATITEATLTLRASETNTTSNAAATFNWGVYAGRLNAGDDQALQEPFKVAYNYISQSDAAFYARNDSIPASYADRPDLWAVLPAGQKRTEWSKAWWSKGSRLTIDITRTLQKDLSNADVIPDIAVLLSANPANRNDTLLIDTGFYPADQGPILTIKYTGGKFGQMISSLRFDGVPVPQGATVTKAYITMTAAADNGDASSDLPLQIKAKTEPNAKPLDQVTSLLEGNWTSPVDWQAPSWKQDSKVNTPDLTSIVQTVVNQGDWCGGNHIVFNILGNGSEGLRTAYSYDYGDDTRVPRLIVEYDPNGPTSGCFKKELKLGLINGSNDGYQWGTATNISNTYIDMGSTNYNAAFRIPYVQVKPGAQIEKAELMLTPLYERNKTANLRIWLDRALNSPILESTNKNISSRFATTDPYVDCIWPAVARGTTFACDVTNLVNTKVKQTDGKNPWSPTNSMTFIVKRVGGDSGWRYLATFEGVASNYLSVKTSTYLKIKGDADAFKEGIPVRDLLIRTVKNITITGVTPINEAIFGMARYITNIEKAGSAGPNHYAVDVNGRSLPSPLQEVCQSTHLVVMTDGSPGDSNIAAANDYLAPQRCSGYLPKNMYGSYCGYSIANFMRQVRQGTFPPTYPDGMNPVYVHSVGFYNFNISPASTGPRYLASLATAGSGRSYTASSASDLLNVFTDIARQAMATNATNISPIIKASMFDQAKSQNQTYFSLFVPDLNDAWQGNVKKYAINTVNAKNPYAVDIHNKEIIDPVTGAFKEDDSLQSYWSPAADSNKVTSGGAASVLPANDERNLYVMLENAGNGESLANTPLSVDNRKLTTDMFAQDDDALRAPLIRYARGFNYNTGSDTPSLRYSLRDPMHSPVQLLPYSCNSGTTFCKDANQVALFSTNGGFIHALDTKTGQELWAVMPQAMLAKQFIFATNPPISLSNPRTYGLDEPISIWFNDLNGNGVLYGGHDADSGNANKWTSVGLNPGEFLYAYVGMGRGGHNLYALDLTAKNTPKALWQIKGGEGSYKQLGQTWSSPAHGRILVGKDVKDVLVFAGGYDPIQDDKTVRSNDTMGNVLYVVDAKTGQLYASASFSGMNYSIPSAVAVYEGGSGSLNGQSVPLITDVFFGDMGGNVWRVSVNNGNSGNNLLTGRLIADLGGNDAANNRRFYAKPFVAEVRDQANKPTGLAVALGSGFKAHPLNTDIVDRFYLLRLPMSNTGDAIREKDLDKRSYDKTDLPKENNKRGWYVVLPGFGGNGEKVVSAANIQGGKVVFNTYTPTYGQNVTGALKSCTPAKGDGHSYFFTLDGAFLVSLQFDTSGLPGDVEYFCTGDTCTFITSGKDLANIPERPDGTQNKVEQKPLPWLQYMKTSWTNYIED